MLSMCAVQGTIARLNGQQTMAFLDALLNLPSPIADCLAFHIWWKLRAEAHGFIQAALATPAYANVSAQTLQDGFLLTRAHVELRISRWYAGCSNEADFSGTVLVTRAHACMSSQTHTHTHTNTRTHARTHARTHNMLTRARAAHMLLIDLFSLWSTWLIVIF